MVQALPAAASCPSPRRRNRRRRAKQQLEAFFADLERELDKVEFFRPEEKRGTMCVNLRNIFHAHGADRSRTSARCTA